MVYVWSITVNNNSIKQIVDALSSPTIDGQGLWRGTKPFTKKNLDDFEKQYTLDCLKGWRYGQSFCNFFGIPNATPLYHFKDTGVSKHWIKYNYLEK